MPFQQVVRVTLDVPRICDAGRAADGGRGRAFIDGHSSLACGRERICYARLMQTSHRQVIEKARLGESYDIWPVSKKVD